MDSNPAPEPEKTRSRFDGPDPSLADVLRPHFSKLRAMKYGRGAGAAVEERVIVAKRDLVTGLEGLQFKMSFRRAHQYFVSFEDRSEFIFGH